MKERPVQEGPADPPEGGEGGPRVGGESPTLTQIELSATEARPELVVEVLADALAAGAPSAGPPARSERPTRLEGGSARRSDARPFMRRIGDYELLSVLGAGGMGIVYRARKLGETEEVALKTVRVSDGRFLSGLRREIQALSKIRHPGIVEVRESGIEDGVPWYAMELLSGPTLRTDMHSYWTSMERSLPPGLPTLPTGAGVAGPREAPARKLPPMSRERLREILSLTARIAESLAFLHGEGFVHRDLKPGNVILAEPGRPVLVDFGLAFRFHKRIQREVLDVIRGDAGTVAYMAPEQIAGRMLDARADLYALGCILHELLTRSVPFPGSRPEAVMVDHLRTPPPLASSRVEGISEDLDALILALLAKEPGGRIPYASDVARRLIELGADPPPRPAAARADAYLYRPSFVGRAGALERLEGALVLAERRQGTALYLVGESGVGKTRLAIELAQRATTRVRVVASECSSTHERSSPLFAFRKILLHAADRCQELGAAETERLFGADLLLLAAYEPELTYVPGYATAVPLPRLTAAAARRRIVQAVLQLIEALSDRRPLLLIFDDLQWADELSLTVIEGLAERAKDRKLLVISTVRAEEIEGPLSAHLEGREQIRVGRLDDRSSREIVASMLGHEPTRELVAEVSANAEGVPFFLAEYLRTAVAEGLIVRSDGRWTLHHERPALPLPGTIRELVARRVERLRPAEIEVLEVAAVLGRELLPEVLIAAASGSGARAGGTRAGGTRDAVGAELTGPLHHLLAEHFLVDRPNGGLAFAHDRVREVVLLAIAPERRRALHRAAVRALEVVYVGRARARVYADLARHAVAAGLDREAADYLELAGEQALDMGSYGIAVERFRDAISRAPQLGVGRVREGRWRRKLADALYASGDLRAAKDAAREALVLLDEPLPEAPARIGLALLSNLGRRLRTPGIAPPEERFRLAEAGLAAHGFALCCYFTYDAVSMIVGCLSAVNLAEQAGLYPHVSKTYAMLGLVAGSMRMPGVARDHLERAARYADQIGDLEGRLFSEICAIAYHLGSGELALAEARAVAAQRMADRLGDPHEKSMVEVTLGHVEYFTGRHAEAAERYGRVTADAQRNDNPQHHAWGLYARARSLVRAGSYGEAVVLAEAARALLSEQADRASEIIALGVLAVARLGLGEEKAALAAAEAALAAMAGNVPTMFATLPGYSGVAQVLLELWGRAKDPGRREALRKAASGVCRALRTQALTFPLAAPAADLHTGHAHLLLGQRRRARSRLRRAAARARELGMPWEEGVALSLLATLLSSEASSEARSEATADRARARAILGRMGAELELRSLEATSVEQSRASG